ncbi:uncharacterized protein LOC112268641 [Brachypodium distachyon]|uniref:uncharacterized protein LOC112268641 n=1 Tax=Brachypodium distachyon TaxID=15368 RepID=UPI000D0D0603|nr:uncharacterized protein LOC112268641 [Brachypodium distachyon]|eukprot:XP_024310320.1 uncharacterized protein LOC112268641 [Brachypodium distachyon]
MTDKLFTDCLQYIAKCNVRDLNIEVRRPALITKLNFNFVEASNLLVRVSLCGIIVSDFNHVGAQPFNNLKVMNLHSVRVNDTILPNVRSLTIMDCSRVLKVDAMAISSIRSFHFKGGNASFYLQGDAFTDLYMYLDYRTTICCLISTEWFDNTIGKTSKLTALTICSNTLQAISLLLNDGRLPQLAKVNFQMLTELQLVIDDKQPVDLDSIFTFLRNCQCPNLKKIFVQLSTISDVQGVDDSPNLVKNRPAVGLENLEIVKITNLTWNNLEMQLVNFLFSQAINLHKMFLVSPNPFPLNMPGLLKEAVDKGQIVLTKSDDAMCWSFHSEAFANL